MHVYVCIVYKCGKWNLHVHVFISMYVHDVCVHVHGICIYGNYMHMCKYVDMLIYIYIGVCYVVVCGV